MSVESVTHLSDQGSTIKIMMTIILIGKRRLISTLKQTWNWWSKWEELPRKMKSWISWLKNINRWRKF